MASRWLCGCYLVSYHPEFYAELDVRGVSLHSWIWNLYFIWLMSQCLVLIFYSFDIVCNKDWYCIRYGIIILIQTPKLVDGARFLFFCLSRTCATSTYWTWVLSRDCAPWGRLISYASSWSRLTCISKYLHGWSDLGQSLILIVTSHLEFWFLEKWLVLLPYGYGDCGCSLDSQLNLLRRKIRNETTANIDWKHSTKKKIYIDWKLLRVEIRSARE